MYRFISNIVKCFIRLFFRVEITGEENIPKEGPFIICANHISAWDPPMLQCFIKRRIYFMAKEELFHIFFVGFILKLIKSIPVKRSGSDITAIKSAMKVLKNGECLGIFPTGQREKVKGEGEVKGGVALLALKTKAPVVAVHIDADYRIFSKVKLTIAPMRVYELEDAKAKATSEDVERISKEIYSSILSLREG